MPYEQAKQEGWIRTSYWNPNSWLNEGHWKAELVVPGVINPVERATGGSKKEAIYNLKRKAEASLIEMKKVSDNVLERLSQFQSFVASFEHDKLLGANAIDITHEISANSR